MQMDTKLCSLISHVRYLWHKLLTISCKIAEKAFWITSHGRIGNSFSWLQIDWGYAWTSAQCHVFRAGYKYEKCNLHSNSKAQDSPVLPARCPGTFIEQFKRSSSKMNGEVTQLTVRWSWEEDDAVQKWKKSTGYWDSRKASTLKNKEYEVIRKIEYQLKMLGINETNDRKHCQITRTHEWQKGESELR